MIKKFKPSIFLYGLLALPLIFIPDRQATSGRVQLYVWLSLLLATAFITVRLSSYRNISRWFWFGFTMAVIPIFITLGSLMLGYKPTYFVGLEPDYMGFLAWIGIVFGGILWAPSIREKMKSNGFTYIFGLLISVSLIVDHYAVVHGLPVSGLFDSSASLAVVANILVILSIQKSHIHRGSLATLVLGTATVVLSQDVFGLICLLVILFGTMLYYRFSRQNKLYSTGLIVAIIAIVLVMPLRFTGLGNSNVVTSWHQLTTLNSDSYKNFMPNQILRGIGPATLPTDINSQNTVPLDVARSQYIQKSTFGTHSLLYDYFVFFGLVGCAGLLWLMVMSVRQCVRAQSLRYTAIYALLLTHALLFPPNIYLTGLLFIMMFGAFWPARKFEPTEMTTNPLRIVLISVCSLTVASSVVFGLHAFVSRQYRLPTTKPTFTENLDSSIQHSLRSAIQEQLSTTNATRGSAVLLDARSGALLGAQDVTSADPSVCKGPTTCSKASPHGAISAWEPGSVVKPLLMAAVLNEKKAELSDTFVNPPFVKVSDLAVYDAIPHQTETIDLQRVLDSSRNTGTIYAYNRLGDGKNARNIWYNYLTKTYAFGKPTGIDSSEDDGFIRSASGSRNIAKQNALSTFGIGLTTTPVQMAAAYATLVNGGTYITPHLVGGRSKVERLQVLSKETSQTMTKSLMQVLAKNDPAISYPDFQVGGKTGTAPAYLRDASYSAGVDIGAFVGFIQNEHRSYVLLIKIDQPQTRDFASHIARDGWNRAIAKLMEQDLLFQ